MPDCLSSQVNFAIPTGPQLEGHMGFVVPHQFRGALYYAIVAACTFPTASSCTSHFLAITLVAQHRALPISLNPVP